ncbi:MAG TPA: GGDEF domain-containing protein [Gammaproteobacteria bacterium]|nr:GGDEF domain-containing protein [Gammaproteobacteria bacterium]
MLRQPISLRMLTGLVVLVMGALGMSLALVTGGIYHRLTLENQRQGLAGLVGLAATEALERQEQKSRALGLSVQSAPAFERALAAGNHEAIGSLLDDQFHQYFVTAGEIRLLQLRLFSPDFQLLAEASEGRARFAPDSGACPGLLERADRRKGPARLQFISALCADPLPLQSLLVPVGGLFLRGYLEVVVDPSLGLEGLAQELGMPLRLRSIDDEVLHQSASWPAEGVGPEALEGGYALRGDWHREVLHVTLLSDVSGLRKELGETRRNILMVATLLTLWVALMMFWILRRTALEPIAGLLQRLENYHHGESGADDAAPAVAIREFHALQDLYDTLDHLAHTDPLTLLPNRTQFRDCLNNYTTGDQRHQKGFALMIMDLNGFKQVNDRHGHQVGDMLLHQVAVRMLASKRRGDILARLGGDEFGMLLPGMTSREESGFVAEKLAALLAEPFQLGTQECRVGLSIGIAFYPDDAVDPDNLISQADAAMYEAKRSGSGYAYARSSQ